MGYSYSFQSLSKKASLSSFVRHKTPLAVPLRYSAEACSTSWIKSSLKASSGGRLSVSSTNSRVTLKTWSG
ncbi:MAG: DUF2690 domain-containing protein [Deltaproteobacteria bacterium]|nr:DUF2690 domain-containing protein [Deltaproteobacteria bacterium]